MTPMPLDWGHELTRLLHHLDSSIILPEAALSEIVGRVMEGVKVATAYESTFSREHILETLSLVSAT